MKAALLRNFTPAEDGAQLAIEDDHGQDDLSYPPLEDDPEDTAIVRFDPENGATEEELAYPPVEDTDDEMSIDELQSELKEAETLWSPVITVKRRGVRKKKNTQKDPWKLVQSQQRGRTHFQVKTTMYRIPCTVYYILCAVY